MIRNIYSVDAKRMRQGTDAFGDRMMTMRRTLIDIKSSHGISLLRDRVHTEGGATITNPLNQAEYRLNVTDSAGDVAQLRTVERGKYVSGT